MDGKKETYFGLKNGRRKSHVLSKKRVSRGGLEIPTTNVAKYPPPPSLSPAPFQVKKLLVGVVCSGVGGEGGGGGGEVVAMGK